MLHADKKVSLILTRKRAQLLLAWCLLILPLLRADMLTCQQIGPNAIQITEPGVVPGTLEPVNEVNPCLLPADIAPPTSGMFVDTMESKPSNVQLPVSDYFDITNLGLVTLTSDALEVGLPSRPLITTEFPEVGPEGSNGATITVGGVTYVVISDSSGLSGVPEPATYWLVLTGIALLGVSKYWARWRSRRDS